MTACTRTRTLKPTFSFSASQLTASVSMQDNSKIIKIQPRNSITSNAKALYFERKFSVGGPTNQPRERLFTLEDGK